MFGKLEYGPQSEEILAFLAEVDDPVNKDVVEAVRVNSLVNDLGMFSGLQRIMAGEGNTVTSVAKRVGREEKMNAAWRVGSGKGAHFGYAVAALSIRDLVGSEFTCEQYETLTQVLTSFQIVAHGTVPGSVERTVACSLMADGLAGKQALEAARGALTL